MRKRGENSVKFSERNCDLLDWN